MRSTTGAEQRANGDLTARNGARPRRAPQRLPGLSPKRQETIRPALERPREFVLLSVRDTAERLNSDPATVIRIVRGLGFKAYREFQRYLQDLTVAHATSLESMQSARDRHSLSGQMQAAVDQDAENLRALRTSLDFNRLASVAKRIWKARRVYLLGGDLATSLVDYAAYHMTLLGILALPGTTTGRVVHLMRSVGKRDLVIAVSFGRGLRSTVEGLQEARRRGAFCVGIADTYVSPIAESSHEFFLASVRTPSFGMAYAAPMSLLNALTAGCAFANRRRTLAVLNDVAAEQRSGSRWYSTQ
ncbi:MAG TPA: MurR/RpiR family transcriptional regulator [Terriglobales bacterium]|nr:MurR/RpiR family transcriptional regulator [Terriglobales bacterium]